MTQGCMTQDQCRTVQLERSVREEAPLQSLVCRALLQPPRPHNTQSAFRAQVGLTAEMDL